MPDQERSAVTHVFHRHLHQVPPKAVSASGDIHPRRRRQRVPRRERRRCGLVPRPRTSGCQRRDACADRPARVRAHELLHLRACRGARRAADPHRARRHEPRVLRQRRLRSGRGGAQDGAAVFRRDRPAAAGAFHRAPAELSRQHARCARGRRQRMAAPRVQAAADRRDARVAVLSVPRFARRRDARGLRTAARGRARSKRSANLGADKVIAFVAETVGGATAGVLVPVPGYFKAVREVCDRHGVPADPRRSDVRHGTHRHAARVRTGRCRART